jgi:hypothetical protein
MGAAVNFLAEDVVLAYQPQRIETQQPPDTEPGVDL